MRLPRKWTIIFALILLLFIPIWLGIIAPILKKIPNNFKYTAETLSLDDFYDEAAKKFQGAYISNTTFSYQLIAKHKGYLEIKNQFSATTLTGKSIFSVSRIYFINPYTWQHADVPGQKNRIGYLFGPRYADEKNFRYWHVNYDAPALLKFIDKEKIDGLSVNHYLAHYSADQTKDLTYLPGVPEERGIKANINLQLWIEPISGWLIKYQDNTQSNYYNIRTGAYIAPWNSFSNTYTQNSIHQQVYQALKLKWKILSVDFGVPLFLSLIIILLILPEFYKKEKIFLLEKLKNKFKKINQSSAPYLFLIILSLIATCAFYIYQNKSPMFIIGISQWNNSSELLKTINGFKKGLADYGFQEGKNVIFITHNAYSNIFNQISAIEFFLHRKVNVIFTATTPGTLVAKGITNTTPIVFSNVNYPEEDNLIASSETSGNNLVGIRNYISPAEQFNAFEKIFPNTKTIGFVHHEGDPDSEMQYQQFKALLSRRNISIIDIAVIDLRDLTHQLQQKTLKYNVLFSACDTLMQEGGGLVVANYSKQHKIPNFSCDEGSIEQGALMGVIADPYAIGVLAGKKTALILLGAEPTWLRTESLEHGSLIINEKTANSIGVTIPNAMLNKANKVIK